MKLGNRLLLATLFVLPMIAAPVRKSMEFRKQRAELLAGTYEKVKQALGAITAARFVVVEDQLLRSIYKSFRRCLS